MDRPVLHKLMSLLVLKSDFHLTQLIHSKMEIDKGKECLQNVDDIILVESDNENLKDDMNLLGDENLGGDGVVVPQVGMKFKDNVELFDFYKRYAYAIGFPVRK
ncbi:uncharacterized protein LOC111383468 isoform X2 [Olea europaea var. sylvestris]|uniref:uncharacterized protein LOC111383468 isoform X2 n=1 Tax=Olea europaea var. sylvestris TaxID=158386 RepID=UPI000C1D882D|nr:uncharacterized protein LOC111383468 isoform X2 [Olea europaea var. sylvestris]